MFLSMDLKIGMVTLFLDFGSYIDVEYSTNNTLIHKTIGYSPF
jgi:hypothetical protein